MDFEPHVKTRRTATISKVTKGFYTGEKNPFSTTSDRVTRVKPYTIKSLANPRAKGTVRLALVSLPEMDKQTCSTAEDTVLRKRKGVHSTGLDHDACRRRVFHFADTRAAEVFGLCQIALDAASKNGADIICFNELAFPAVIHAPLKEAIDYFERFADENRTLIIGGSAHDRRTLYNSGQLFYPHDPEKPEKRIYYHKQVSAIGTSELVSMPCERKTITVKAFGLHTAILVCLDIADYSTVASLFAGGNENELLIVPCHSKLMEDPLGKMAELMSRAMPGIVVLNNHWNPSAPESSSVVYKFGRKQSADSFTSIPLADHLSLVLYDIDLDAFRDERGQRSDERDAMLQQLFGFHTAESR
jgi:hypothetical protein